LKIFLKLTDTFFITFSFSIIHSEFLITDNNEKKSTSETKTTTGKINEQNKQNGQQRRNDSQKNLLIDLSNDPKPAGNSWVSDETLRVSL